MNGRGRRDVAAVIVAPLALILTGAWMKAAHGPSWLGYNLDPTYAYLTNALLLLRGVPPFHIAHPGIPVVAIGSVTTAVTHLVAGQGTLVEDVIARPEAFITSAYWAVLILSATLLAAGGWIAARRWGNAALLVQAGPWLSAVGVSLGGQLRAETLLLGLTVLWAACLVAYSASPPRTAVVLGALTGAILALHLSALPLLVAPLLLLETTRDRARFLGATAAGFLVAFSPAILKLPSFIHYAFFMSLRSSQYAHGPMTVINIKAYGPALLALIQVVPLNAMIGAISGAVWLAWRAAPPADERERTARRALGALAATDLCCFLLTAKHPDVHYLVPTLCTMGANLWLIGQYLRARLPAHRRALAYAALAVIAVVQTRAIGAEAALLLRVRADQQQAARHIAEFVDGRGCFLLSANPASSEAQALQWGNLMAQSHGRPVLGPEIAQRFPRSAFDMGHLEIRDADWNPMDLEALFHREPCVVYASQTLNGPRTSARIAVEVLATSGWESLYRLRPAQ